jgi:hypothetical protein
MFSYHHTSNISELFPNGTATRATEDEVGETVFPCICLFFNFRVDNVLSAHKE